MDSPCVVESVVQQATHCAVELISRLYRFYSIKWPWRWISRAPIFSGILSLPWYVYTWCEFGESPFIRSRVIMRTGCSRQTYRRWGGRCWWQYFLYFCRGLKTTPVQSSMCYDAMCNMANNNVPSGTLSVTTRYVTHTIDAVAYVCLQWATKSLLRDTSGAWPRVHAVYGTCLQRSQARKYSY